MISSGPLYVEGSRLSDLKPGTLLQYQRAAGRFLAFLDRESFYPESPDAWDDLLVEWCVSDDISLSQYRCGIAAIEFVYPRLKGHLLWARQRLSSWEARAPVRHAEPAGREICALLGAQLASMRRARMGLGITLQNALGLRPSEMLKLTAEDVQLSPESDKLHKVIVRLGARTGTKSGREQFAVLDTRKWPALWTALQIAIDYTPPLCRLFPFSLASVYHWLKAAQAQLHVDLRITPHSPRAGFVTDELVAGTPPPVIKEAGRWASDTSFRRYIDAVGALRAAQTVRLAGHGPSIAWVTDHWDEYYTVTSLNIYGGTGGRRPSRRLAAPAEGEELASRVASGESGDRGAASSSGARGRGNAGRGAPRGGRGSPRR